MTRDRSRKLVIRARMAANGEPYSEAARRVAEQWDPATGVFGGPVGRPYAAAAVLFLDQDDRVLIVRRPDRTDWDLPGRLLRPTETPATVSVALVPELLGISPVIARMLVVDWSPHPEGRFPEADKATFVFDGGRLSPDQTSRITADPREIAEYAFHAPGALNGLVIPVLERRITAAVAARANGPDRYLELGLGGR